MGRAKLARNRACRLLPAWIPCVHVRGVLALTESDADPRVEAHASGILSVRFLHLDPALALFAISHRRAAIPPGEERISF